MKFFQIIIEKIKTQFNWLVLENNAQLLDSELTGLSYWPTNAFSGKTKKVTTSAFYAWFPFV